MTNDWQLEICRPTQTDDPKIKKKYGKVDSGKSKHQKIKTKKNSGQGYETLLSNLGVQNYNKVKC